MPRGDMPGGRRQVRLYRRRLLRCLSGLAECRYRTGCAKQPGCGGALHEISTARLDFTVLGNCISPILISSHDRSPFTSLRN